MAKKATPKVKHGNGKRAKSDETTVELYLPEELYKRLHEDNPDENVRDALIRAVFRLSAESTKVFGMDTCKILPKPRPVPKSDDEPNDDDGKEPKLCEEGP